MNGQRIIAAEFAASVSIITYGSTKEGFWPWPANIARSAFAFAILSLLGLVNENLAALLGMGFLLAQILKTPVDENGNFKFTGGIEKQQSYLMLDLGGKTEKKAQRSSQNWSPGGASNKGAALPATGNQKPNNGGIVSV